METLSSEQNNAQKLQNLYSGALSRVPTHEELEEIEKTWEVMPTQLEIQHGDTIGRFGREAVSLSLGGRAGYTISINAQTATGRKPLELSEYGPEFKIREPEPELKIEPLVEDYALRPIKEGFDWPGIFAKLGVKSAYVFGFRSRKNPDADDEILLKGDDRAHKAAKKSPGFLFYRGGEVDENGNALSVCAWTDRQAALEAIGGSDHKAAASLIDKMYISYSPERYSVSIDAQNRAKFEQV